MTATQVKVKVIGFDDRGKVKLSMRVVDQATGADISDQVGARRPRARMARAVAASAASARVATGRSATGGDRPRRDDTAAD